jgi:hypothetical protein
MNKKDRIRVSKLRTLLDSAQTEQERAGIANNIRAIQARAVRNRELEETNTALIGTTIRIKSRIYRIGAVKDSTLFITNLETGIQSKINYQKYLKYKDKVYTRRGLYDPT